MTYPWQTNPILRVGHEKALNGTPKVAAFLQPDLSFDPLEQLLVTWDQVPHKRSLLNLAVIPLVIPSIRLDEGAERGSVDIPREEDSDFSRLASEEGRTQAELFFLPRVLGPGIYTTPVSTLLQIWTAQLSR